MGKGKKSRVSGRVAQIDTSQSAVLVVRSALPAKSFLKFDEAERALAPAGYVMSSRLAPDYRRLLQRLRGRFGDPVFFCSPDDLCSTLTLATMFRPEHICMDERLGAPFDLRTIEGGAWCERRPSATWPDQLDELTETLQSVSPDAADDVDAMVDFLLDRKYLRRARFRVVVAAESLISLAVAHVEPEDEDPIRLGLYSGQAFLMYFADRSVRHVERFEPAATRLERPEQQAPRRASVRR